MLLRAEADDIVHVQVAVHDSLRAKLIRWHRLDSVDAFDHATVDDAVGGALREVVGAKRLADAASLVEGVSPHRQAPEGEVREHVQVQVCISVHRRCRVGRGRRRQFGRAVAIRFGDHPVRLARAAVRMEPGGAGISRPVAAQRLALTAARPAESEHVSEAPLAALLQRHADARVGALCPAGLARSVRAEAERIAATAQDAGTRAAGDFGESIHSCVSRVESAAAARRNRIGVPAGLGDAARALTRAAAGAHRLAGAARGAAEEDRQPRAAAGAVAQYPGHFDEPGRAGARRQALRARHAAAALPRTAARGLCRRRRREQREQQAGRQPQKQTRRCPGHLCLPRKSICFLGGYPEGNMRLGRA